MRNFGLQRRDALHPAFDLSRASYFLDFALVPAAILILLAFMPDPLALASFRMMAIGFVAWSLAEYWIHRLVFHGRTPFEPMHQMHHSLPKDMIGVASWGTFAGFAAIAFLFGSPVCIGFMLGYLAYCTIHVRMHHGNRTRFSRYVAFMFDHHAGHHRGGAGNFGVTPPLWDFIFRTQRKTSP